MSIINDNFLTIASIKYLFYFLNIVKRGSESSDFILTLISAQVSDFYKPANIESPAKAALEESSHMFENRGVQMLGQIRHGSCRPRAILFKVLADTVGLESRLMMVSSNIFCLL